MAEFTSWPLRLLAQAFGASFACTEMVKARFVLRKHPATMKVLVRHPSERLCGAQICGDDPDVMAGAARFLVQDLTFPFVDLNLACPIRRIFGEGAGGALLKSPERVEQMVRTVRDAVAPAPVTVKMRSGMDRRSITAVEVAVAAERGGAALIAIHPRTVRQGYEGKPDHGITTRVADAVALPVVAGGDVRSASEAVRLLRETGCGLVHVARAAIGDPWIFSRADALLKTGTEPALPCRQSFASVFLKHAEWLAEHMGEHRACRHVRRLSKAYAKRIEDQGLSTRFYEALRFVESIAEVRAFLATGAF
jgi:nifR3 family TIM-barrel protein